MLLFSQTSFGIWKRVCDACDKLERVIMIVEVRRALLAPSAPRWKEARGPAAPFAPPPSSSGIADQIS